MEMYVLLLALGRRPAPTTMKTKKHPHQRKPKWAKRNYSLFPEGEAKFHEASSACFTSRSFFCISYRDLLINVTPVTNTDRIPYNLYGWQGRGASAYTNLHDFFRLGFL